MILRRLHLAIGLGLVCTTGALLGARRVAGAQRRHSDLPLVTSAHDGATHDRNVGSNAPARGRPTTIDAPVDGFDPTRMQRDHARYVVDMPDHRRAVLTVEPAWQRS